MSNFKIGAVSYLNTKPLVYGLDDRSDEFEMIYDLPSRLADSLAAGDLDVALIPVIEAISNPSYTVVSDACIACRGPVLSVKLFGRVKPEEIKTLALDEGSRTSAALTQVILNQKYAVEPILEELPISRPWRDSKSDAVLVIGDRAMKDISAESADEFDFVWDLGQFWNEWTGLPFVFAVWAARPGIPLEGIEHALNAARDSGLNAVEEICNRHRSLYDMQLHECRDYLTKNLHFKIGQHERRGLELYFELLKKQNIISQNLNLQFHDCQTT